MKQKDIKEEIFILLRKSEKHQRGLARVLGTSQTNVRRALLNLEKENIVDKREIGKSKVYFIKESLESAIYERIVENYKLMKILEKPKIRKVFAEIYQKTLSGKLDFNLVIVLFGSYSKGLESGNSDVDIYINSDSKKYKKEIEEISGGINLVRGKFDKGNKLFEEIKKDHIILNNIDGFFKLVR